MSNWPSGERVSVNPFDEANGNSFVCSLMWRNTVPPARELVYGEVDYAGRLGYLEQDRADIRARSQRKKSVEPCCSDM
jgi:hypothetical protein